MKLQEFFDYFSLLPDSDWSDRKPPHPGFWTVKVSHDMSEASEGISGQSVGSCNAPPGAKLSAYVHSIHLLLVDLWVSAFSCAHHH